MNANLPDSGRPYDRGEKARIKAARRWSRAGGIEGVCPCGRKAGDVTLGSGVVIAGNDQTCLRHFALDPAVLAASILSRTFSEVDLSKRDAARAHAFAAGNPEGFTADAPPIPKVFRKKARR